ncbi:hypothetical protein [Vibrio vulnificus]|uniref:hypothetical protein n=1 Tax=Vibrio vulnificus TaxID=672 RepID=UPI001A20C818|nr:hypothetical protein [Vibrio vulnificus]MCA3928394.1 hypothetical protein [Vibrio vulnificus]HAS6051470.1 hypothetical protein [Vibrio vulnificus]
MNKTKLAMVCALLTTMAGCNSGSSSDGPGELGSPNIKGDPSLDKIYSYQESDLSTTAIECAKIYKQNLSCSLEKIRPIGANRADDITLDEIQSRLLVSHQWMAESFIAALKAIDDQDLLNLFKPLNTIVLSYDIRPSFYHSRTASMYIDARYLWRDYSDWRTIHQQDDYRKEFAREFTYENASRYVYGQTLNYVTVSNQYDSMRNSTRSAEKIAPGLFRLLAHELAHANDLLPPHDLIELASRGTILNEVEDANHIYSQLSSTYGLTSQLLLEAAETSFHGKPMTDLVRNSTGEQAGGEFETDGAAAFYGYSTEREDVATLFENYMMHKKYGAINEVAFVSVPQTEAYTCDDWKILWGQRDRLSDKNVRSRVLFVAQQILNQTPQVIEENLPPVSSVPTAMPIGKGWCETLGANYDSAAGARFAAPYSEAGERFGYLEDIGTKE